MLIYQRHIISNIVTPLVTIILTMTGLVWMSQIVKFVYLIDRGVGFREFAYLVILVLPSLFFTIMPFAMAIGILVSYNRLSYERELIALSNSGLSPMALAKPALMVATVVAIIGYLISAYILPLSYSALKTNLANFRNNYASSLVQDRVFTQVAKNITLYVDDKTSGGLLKGVILFDDRNIDRRVILFAKSGRIRFQSGAPSFELQDGTRQEVDQLGKMSKMHFSNLSVVLDQGRCNPSILAEGGGGSGAKTPECTPVIDSANRDLQEHYLHELFAPDYDLSDLRRTRLKSEGHQRLIWPLYSLALTTLALGIFMQKPYSRRGNNVILMKTGVALIVVIGCHFAAQNASSKNEVMNLLGYVNIVVCSALGYFLLADKWVVRKKAWLKFLL